MSEPTTWHYDTQRLGPGYITNGVKVLKTWNEASTYLTELERALTEANARADRAERNTANWGVENAQLQTQLAAAIRDRDAYKAALETINAMGLSNGAGLIAKRALKAPEPQA